MLVRMRLVRLDGSRRDLTVARRDAWLPAARYREALTPITPLTPGAFRDYVLDRRASDSGGVLVYRELPARREASA